MSFDLFINSFRRHEPYAFDSGIVEDLFGPLIEARQPQQWKLKAGGYLSVDDTPTIDNLSVNRPPNDPAFWRAIFQLLMRTPTVLHWPGVGTIACVVNPDVIENMPPDWVEGTHPVVVRSVEEILETIENS